MLSRARSVAAALLAALALHAPASAQDKDKELVKKAKDAAAANLKKANITKPTIVETDNFLVVGSLSEEKAKALGAVLEKTLKLARATLKYEEKESAWRGGKLTVYFLPDPDEYKSFMRRVLQVSPEGMHVDFRADPPLLVDPAEVPGKPTDADLYVNTAARVAGEHIKAKGTGTQAVPEWLRDGFGRVTALRAEGVTSKRYQTYRTQARAAVLATRGGKPPALADIWSDARSATGELLAASFSEFLAYGGGSANFHKFLDGLKPTETVGAPTVQNGFEAAGWKDQAALDRMWKRWVATGK
jgi:hypothetical protein